MLLMATTSLFAQEGYGSDIETVIQCKTNELANELNTANIKEVWRPRKFVNISAFKLGSNTLTPQQDIRAGLVEDKEKDLISEFKSNWEVSFLFGFNPTIPPLEKKQWGRLGLDIVVPDLTLSHYEAASGGCVYDSRLRHNESPYVATGYAYTPWNLEKYQMNIGARVGPSITVVPFFESRSVPELQHIRLNAYLHIGYRASLLFMSGNKEADASFAAAQSQGGMYEDFKSKYTDTEVNYESFHDKIANGTKMEWGHGATTTFGFNVSWKWIGLGYERTSGDITYKSALPGTYGNDEVEFRNVTSRVYLQLRW